MRARVSSWLLVSLLVVSLDARAGGGPMNVLVLYNADDPDAADVADHYASARSIPAAQLCGVTGVDPSARTVSFDDFDSLIRTPLDACLSALADPLLIDYVVVVRGLPYRVNVTDGYCASLSAMVQVGHAADGGGVELAGSAQVWDPGGYWVASVTNPAYISGYPSAGDYTLTNPYSS